MLATRLTHTMHARPSVRRAWGPLNHLASAPERMLSASVRAASARSSLPSAARRLPSRSRAAPARRAMASSAVPEGLSDGCKGAPAAPGAKLPLMAPESVMSAKAHGTSERPVQDTLRYGCDPKLADRICWCARSLSLRAGCARRGPRLGACVSLELGVFPCRDELQPLTARRRAVRPLVAYLRAASTATTRRCAPEATRRTRRAAQACLGGVVQGLTLHRSAAQHAGYFVTTNWLKEVDRNVETTYYDSVTGLPLFIAPRGRTFAAFEAESRSHGWPSFRDAEVRMAVHCARRALLPPARLPERGVADSGRSGCVGERAHAGGRRVRVAQRDAPRPQPAGSHRQPLLHQPGVVRWLAQVKPKQIETKRSWQAGDETCCVHESRLCDKHARELARSLAHLPNTRISSFTEMSSSTSIVSLLYASASALLGAPTSATSAVRYSSVSIA